MRNRPVGAELFHADGWTDGHDEASSRFSQFYERAGKKKQNTRLHIVILNFIDAVPFKNRTRKTIWVS